METGVLDRLRRVTSDATSGAVDAAANASEQAGAFEDKPKRA